MAEPIKSRVIVFDRAIDDDDLAVTYFAAGTKSNSVRVRVTQTHDYFNEAGDPTGEHAYEVDVWTEQGWQVMFTERDAKTAGHAAEVAAAVLCSTTPSENDTP